LFSVLCLGDSNTYGYDPRSWGGGRYSADIRWTGLLSREGLSVRNLGENGLSIPAGPRLQALVTQLRAIPSPEAVTVMLGSNDLLQGASAEETSARMRSLLTVIRRVFPNAAIVLIAPPPMVPGDWVQDEDLIARSRALPALYRAAAQEVGVCFADAGRWEVPLSFDGVHFSPEGHAVFARRLFECFPPPLSSPADPGSSSRKGRKAKQTL